MKFFALSFFTALIFFANTCNRQETEGQMELTGKIESQGITSYQYGTHVLKTKNEFYALRSDKIDLDKFIGKKVTVSGSRIDGYPVDGGPLYILVTNAKQL